MTATFSTWVQFQPITEKKFFSVIKFLRPIVEFQRQNDYSVPHQSHLKLSEAKTLSEELIAVAVCTKVMHLMLNLTCMIYNKDLSNKWSLPDECLFF